MGQARQRFGHYSIADDVLDGIDLTGKTAIVTGASAGLGFETTRALASHGAHVVMAVREMKKGKSALEELKRLAPPGNFELCKLDLSSLESVRAFADEFLSRHQRLNILICNAGVMGTGFSITQDGFERQFGTNHLGHFVLTNRLAPALVAGAPARVIMLSAFLHALSDVNLEDPNFETTPYRRFESYGQSKTANILFAVEFDRRFQDRGVRAFALHPGVILTDLSRYFSADNLQEMLAEVAKVPGGAKMKPKTLPQGTATSVWAATSPALNGKGGLYLEDCQIAETTDPDQAYGVRAYALDPESARKLWTLSEKMVGETFNL